ncbi:MAG: hypothetical protein HY343_08280 [Lentisphaerae bacterium]|nr:hypothetical protein [Lentisphaerota bacterium]
MNKQLDRSQDGSGSLLTMVFGLAIVLTVLAGAAYFTSSSGILQTKQAGTMERGFYIAEAGVEHAKSILVNASNGFSPLLIGSDGAPNTPDDGILSFGDTVSLGDGSYRVKLTDDNDGDSNLFADTNNVVIITSTGLLAGIHKTLEVTVSNYPAKIIPPSVDGAFAFYGTNSSLDMDGTPNIDGADYALPTNFVCGGAGCELTATTNEETAGVFSSTNLTMTIDGTSTIDGTPAVTTNTGDYVQQDWFELAAVSTLMADIVFPGGVIPGNQIIGSRENPQIVVINGQTTFSGTVDGAGILICNADVVFAGTFHWEGLVILMGAGAADADLELRDTGNSTVFGAVVSAGNNNNVHLQGTSDVVFSSEALDNLANLGVFEPRIYTVSWREIKSQ